MNIKQLLQEFEKVSLQEMTIHKSTTSFEEFYENCISKYNYIKKRNRIKDKQKALQLYPKLPYENVLNAIEKQNILITYETIVHVLNNHVNITLQDWLQFIQEFNPKKDPCQTSAVQGNNNQKYIYKCEHFGYVIRTYPTAQAQLVTMFKDHPHNIDNWFNNEYLKTQKASE